MVLEPRVWVNLSPSVFNIVIGIDVGHPQGLHQISDDNGGASWDPGITVHEDWASIPVFFNKLYAFVEVLGQVLEFSIQDFINLMVIDYRFGVGDTELGCYGEHGTDIRTIEHFPVVGGIDITQI